MPSDLDQLAQDADHQDRWGTPPTGNGLQDVAGQQQMTHQPDQPNLAQPYVDWLRGAARRTFVNPLQDIGLLPGGQDWGRPAFEGMMNFGQSGLTGVNPSLRNVMPGAANTLGDLVRMNTSGTTSKSLSNRKEQWMDHNSRAFHQDFGKISPEGEYRNQLQTAVMAVQKFGFPPEIASGAYGVRLEDIMKAMRTPNGLPGQQPA